MNRQKQNVGVGADERAPLLASEPEAGENNGLQNDHSPSSAVIWLVFPILLAGVFLSNVVSSIVIATNQVMASEFDALSSSAWLLTTYTLAQSATQPLYGKLSDIYGRRACLIFCWTVFGLGCFLVYTSAVGRRYWQILLGRALGGIGSAGKVALTSIIVTDVIPLPKVAQYRAFVNLTATTARSLGGPIGGWLAGSVGWRLPFLVQTPMAVIGLALVLWKLPEPNQERGLYSVEEPGPAPSKISRVDFVGAMMLVGTVLTGLLSLDLATKQESRLGTLCLAAAFVVFILSFYLVESRYAKEPILPLDLVTKRDVLTSYLIVCFQAAGQFGLLYSIPIYFQVVGRESISSSSNRIVPVVAGNAFGTIVSQRIITRLHKYKLITVIGNLAGLVGFSLIIALWRRSIYWSEALLVALPGIGMGIIQSSTFVHLAASLDHSEIAIAGASWFLAQNIGILIGASLSTASINYMLKETLEELLNGVDGQEEIIKNSMSDVGYIRRLPDKIWSLVSTGYIRAIAWSHVISIVLVSTAFVATISMRERPLKPRDSSTVK